MRARRGSAAPSIRILPQAERGEEAIGARGREHGLTSTTCYRWRQPCGGRRISAAQRRRARAPSPARLTRVLAARALEGEALRAFRANQP
jgi:hypothetical protein